MLLIGQRKKSRSLVSFARIYGIFPLLLLFQIIFGKIMKRHNTCQIDLVFGPIGAGKSYVSAQLVHKHNSILLATDDWFQKLFFPDITSTPTMTWATERINRCEDLIWNVAMQIVHSSTSVVLDIGLATRDARLTYLERCQSKDLQYSFHYVTAPIELRKKRVAERNKQVNTKGGYVVSDGMFQYTDGLFEVPDAEELTALNAVIVRNEGEV